MNYKILLPLFAILACIVSCDEHLNDYYAGIVVDELGRPIPDAILKEDFYGEIDSIHKTDNNGYFKFNMSERPLENFIVMKEGYISDTIRMVWHQHGETTEFSPIIISDSSKIVLESIANTDILFNTKEIDYYPDFNSIIKSRHSKKMLEGTWLKDDAENLNGFRFDDNGVYIFGEPGNKLDTLGLSHSKQTKYIIVNDSITLYKEYYYDIAIGVILNNTNTELTIKWMKNNIVTYKKLK